MKIGNLEFREGVFLAPMAGITDPPFRKVVQRFGVSGLWTEMISAHGLVQGGRRFATTDLGGHVVPTIFQIYGHDPEIMAEAADMLQDVGAAAVDINMGCPVKKVVRKGSGAALMKDMPLAGRIVAAVRKRLRIPLSVKIRSGWDERNRNAPQLAQIAEEQGADLVVLHSRSRSAVHSGPVDMGILAEVKRKVCIPVIGNGGIRNADDAVRMVEETGCDGVMIGRGALGRPWFPGLVIHSMSGGSAARGQTATILEVVKEHFRYQLELRGVLTGVRRMRKHLVWYSRGLAASADFRKRMVRMDDPEEVLTAAERFFGDAVIS
jgi:tRNA-dihydrouridine synthase B